MSDIAEDSKEQLTEIYDYDGLYYKVTETEAVHQRLQTDVDYAASYFESKQAILRVTSNDTESSNTYKKEGGDSSAKDFSLISEAQFKWDHISVQILLNEYLKLKDKFYDPKIKKVLLWGKIRETFLEQGIDLSIEYISTKFRNLKKTFLKIYYNNKAPKAGKGKITWDYYSIFLEILKDDETLGIKNLSSPSNPVQDQCGSSFRRIAPAPPGPSPATLALASALASGAVSTKNKVIEKKTPFNLRKAAKRRAVLLRKRQRARIKKLESEEQRLQEIQHLVYVIRENNNIQKERNSLLKELINKCKCNETVKLFV